MFAIKDVVADLIKVHGYHEGLFDPSVEFQIGVGSFGPTPANVLPGAVVSVSKFGLQRTSVVGPHTVDAAKVNPVTKSRKGKGAAS
jgi:hypothetical protein